MKLQRIVGIMLLLFLAEGTVFYWLMPDSLAGRVIPRFTLAFVLFAAMYRDRHTALLLGFFFGLLQDMAYYGRMIGVHAFGMAIAGYLTGFIFKRKKPTMMMSLSVMFLSTLFYEALLYSVYRLFRLTHETFEWALSDHILPSLLLQVLFALALYVPARRWFEGSVKKKAEEEEE
ncbi:rod shape-determining protein MreD [Paenibacillus humicola]|uniref:rod shape-determining protein MreD n=1 Tax=Paenibacillus humicola TaxID=3110540 RepID=UPI00237B2FDE|nr:rod shape-determining protein MreD [Paenibacillus humicola]